MEKQAMELSDIVSDQTEITPELIKSLKLPHLKIVAKELFEISSPNKFNKQQLVEECIRIFEEQKPNEVVKTDREILRDWVADIENRKAALQIAQDIRNNVNRLWFTATELHSIFTNIRSRNIDYLEKTRVNDLDPTVRVQAERDLNELTSAPVETAAQLTSRLAVLTLFRLVKSKKDPKGKRPTCYRIDQGEIERQAKIIAKSEKQTQEEA